MKETSFRELIERYQELVENLEQLIYQEEEHVSCLRAKLRLFDGSILWVREIYCDDQLDTYSYYWLRSDDSLIIGWDNAPHHPEIETFPHHRHQQGKILASEKNTLDDVLRVVQQFFENL